MKRAFLFCILLIILSSFVYAQESCPANKSVEVVMFYGSGCPHCAQEESLLNELQTKYTNLKVIRYEVYFNQSNRELFKKFVDFFGTELKGVPTLFVDKKVFIGFSDKTGQSIEDEIKRCNQEGCASPDALVKGETSVIETEGSPTNIFELKQLTLPAVILGAIVDSINPCEFAVLIILLATILATAHNRKKALFAGLAFSASIFISYFLMGLGLFSILRAAGLTTIFYKIVAVLAIIIGLFNLKDYLWYGKWFIMEVPLSWRPRMKMLIKSVTSVPGAFLIGVVVSLFLLPCTSGPYIVILGLLAKSTTQNHALALLVLYNFIFVLPMLLITFAIYFGITTTEKAEHWREKKLKILHLIAGIILLILGIAMLISSLLGYV